MIGEVLACVRECLKSARPQWRWRARRAGIEVEWPHGFGIVDLQKSSWGAQYYCNCAFALRARGAMPKWPEHKADLRTRLTQIASGESEIRDALDFEKKIDIDRRREVLREALITTMVPILDKWSDETALREFLKSSLAEPFSLSKWTRDHFLSES